MKILLLSLAFIFFFPDNYEDFLKKGDEFHKNFDNKNAVLQYEKAFNLAPGNYEVLLKLTSAYNDLGEEYVELSRRNKEGNYREEAKKYIDKAVHYAELFHKKFPDSAAVYCCLALSYGNLAMFRGSKEKIKLAHKVKDNAEKSIRMNPDNFTAYVILGIYNREVGNLSFFERLFAETFFGDVPDGSFEESIKMFNKALAIIPNSIVPAFQLSRTYRFMGEEEKERELLKKLLSYEVQNFRDKYAIDKAKKRLEQL